MARKLRVVPERQRYSFDLSVTEAQDIIHSVKVRIDHFAVTHSTAVARGDARLAHVSDLSRKRHEALLAKLNEYVKTQGASRAG